MTKHHLLDELDQRSSFVEKNDMEIRSKNNSDFRTYWLQMVVLTSALVVGVLPVLTSPTSIMKSPVLAQLGLLILVLICVLIISYFQNVLVREKALIFDQFRFHSEFFAFQKGAMKEAVARNYDEKQLSDLFEKLKSTAAHEEQDIVMKHLVSRKASRVYKFIDKNIHRTITYGFAIGVLLIILSFVVTV